MRISEILFIPRVVVPLLVAVCATASVSGQTTRPAATKFMRFVEDGAGGGRLESAIVTYHNDDGVSVDLIAALHVAEKSYYRRLEDSFDDYDAVLYEMIKPRGAAPPGPGAVSKSGVSGLQRWLKRLLQLEFQLDAIDYTRDNFVHADLDLESFQGMQRQRGESLLGLMLRAMLREMSRPTATTQPTLDDIMRAMASPDSARQYKLLLAPQFQDMENIIAGFEGPDGSVLVTERNNAAVRALKDSIAGNNKSIAIFFGAAHMPGIEQQMTRDLGFQRVATTWLVAWDMTAKHPPTTAPWATAPAAR